VGSEQEIFSALRVEVRVEARAEARVGSGIGYCFPVWECSQRFQIGGSVP